MIFDKNYLKPSNETAYHVYQEESEQSDFVNPYNDSPYLISSLQKLRNKVSCKRKRKAIEDCLENYKHDTVENPEINVFKNVDDLNTTASFADYARSSYQKVLKDIENLQKLMDKLDMNEPDSVRIIS
ncbi:hypothetical protein [Chryseobacterium sp. FH1]|uniref:hypothetical protein n=1 Tax=Chryseobacterium sp. FH1 TaxID=1233951 RepID=UPI0004E3F26D|nr:hypothetical protein [Chryseobacterium sp. FH1]KFC19174.1 hypothetical protein IO90_07580 [Chryseobacterium sp. FH1]